MAERRPSPIRIGNGAGFWGDNLDAPVALARSGEVDVLTLEYLAELTLAILAHQRSKDPAAGFIADFPELLERLAGEALLGGLAIVTNAGGLNPRACASRCGAILERHGLGVMRSGRVAGDDVLPKLAGWSADGVDLAHMETGEPIHAFLDRFVSANAYLGAEPIARACGQGARIIVTGRVADASLTLGPAAAHFGWGWDDMDRLAGASVAGHLIECAQATGGLWHKWDEVHDADSIGYPIAVVEEDGSSTITKPGGSGGLVTVATVAEQIVYEIDDPARYRTPDVDVDLTTVRLEQTAKDQVRVSNATGRPPSGKLKVAAVYRDGWTASGMVAVVGRDAERKARAAGRLVLDRARRGGYDPAESLVECLGANDVAPGVVPLREPPFEVVLRVTVRDPRRAAVERFCRELAPLVTSGPPGIAGYASGRPQARPAFAYWPTLIDAALVKPELEVRPARDWVEGGEAMSRTVRLGDLAHCRSGDKGDRANIGVVAEPRFHEHLKANLTPEAVAAYLAPMGVGPVARHELPNIHAFNFVIDKALGGGASRSLRLDTQGKALGTVLMEMPVPARGWGAAL